MDRIKRKGMIFFLPLRFCAFASLRLIEPGAAVIESRFARLGKPRAHVTMQLKRNNRIEGWTG